MRTPLEREYMRHVLEDRPDGYWPMNETAGTTGKNWGAVSSVDGTFTSATLGAHVNPLGSPAPRFTGSASYMEVADNAAWTRASGGWTVEALSLVESLPSGTAMTIAAKGNVLGSTGEWALQYSDFGGASGTKAFMMVFHNADASNNERIAVSATNSAYNARQWRHIATVWDGTALWLVIDGRPVVRSTTNGGATYADRTGTLRFGAYATIQLLTGSVCHGAIFPRALSFNRLLERARLAGRA